MDSGNKLRWGAACLNCRKYKIRCDGGKPICGRCAQFGRTDCAYGRGPPPSLDARLHEQFADFGQRVNVITPAAYPTASQGSSGASSSASGSSRPRTPAPPVSQTAFPPEFPGPSEIYGLSSWERRSELPVYTRQHMLEILIPHRSQFSMDFHYGRWRRTIMLSASDPNSFHPCLVWAIALAAVSLCSAGLREYETIFRVQAEAELANSLAYADRLEDSMWARVVLSWHSIRQGRLMAALNLSTANVSLALSSNLHAMPGADYYAQADSGLLPPPFTKQHAIERAHLWWSIYLIDVEVSLILGVQGNTYLDPLEVNAITTRLPMAFDISPGTQGSRSQVASGMLVEGAQWLADDTVFCLWVKSTILLHASVLATRSMTGPNIGPQVWERYAHLETSFASFMNAMPSLDDMRGLDGGDGLNKPDINPSMLRVQMATLLGAYFLTSIPNSPNGALREKRIGLALQGAEIARQVGDLDVKLIYPHVTIGTVWYMMAETLIDEIALATTADQAVGKQRLRSALAGLRIYASKLTMLQGFYTGLRLYLGHIERELLLPPGRTVRTSRRPNPGISPFVLDSAGPYMSGSS